MDRGQLLETLYDARSENYPDLRSLKTTKSLLDRRIKVMAMLGTQKEGSDRWKKLSIEREFIRMKLVLCFKDSPPSIEIILDKNRIELLDMHTYESPEEKKETKKRVSLILLKYVMLKKSDDELRALVDGLK